MQRTEGGVSSGKSAVQLQILQYPRYSCKNKIQVDGWKERWEQKSYMAKSADFILKVSEGF